jgi:hypothetical protein
MEQGEKKMSKFAKCRLKKKNEALAAGTLAALREKKAKQQAAWRAKRVVTEEVKKKETLGAR